MSRIGKHEVEVPESVNLSIDGNIINVKGKLGELSTKIIEGVKINYNDNKVAVKPNNDDKSNISKWGLMRTLINNMVVGVEEGFSKTLEVNGVGYRAAIEADVLQLQLQHHSDTLMEMERVSHIEVLFSFSFSSL